MCCIPGSLIKLKVEPPAKATCVTHYMYLVCRSSGSSTRERTEEKKEPESIAGVDQLQAVCQQYLQVCKFYLYSVYLALLQWNIIHEFCLTM